MLLRTFSKVYGLCGLRVGFALCGSDDFVTAVNQVRQPFFCNAAAQAAAIEALRHQDEVNARVERTIVARLELEDGLRELGIEPAESQANFCWFDLPVADGEEPAEVEARVVRRARRARRARARGQRPRARRRAARDLRHARRRTRASCASWAPCSRREERGQARGSARGGRGHGLSGESAAKGGRPYAPASSSPGRAHRRLPVRRCARDGHAMTTTT